MTKTYVTFNRKAIKEHNCELVMTYVSQLIDNVLNGNEVISYMSFNLLKGCISGLELLGVINVWDGKQLIDNVLKEVKESIE